jgi:hypothetical protein
MTDRSVPIELGGEIYHLRFERKDIRDIERAHAPLLMLLQPGKFGWDMAAIILHKGLKRETETGDLVYAFPQTTAGEDDVFKLVQDFTNQFQGISVGLAVLYGAINGGMVVSGWFQGHTPDKHEEGSQVVDPSKNSQKPRKTKKKLPSDSAGSHREN